VDSYMITTANLKHHLDTFLESFPKERGVSNDPVQFVHRYDDPRDREIAGRKPSPDIPVRKDHPAKIAGASGPLKDNHRRV